ncbi:hypothetical protein EMCRGX_G005477 [Ephydatia muelleri]
MSEADRAQKRRGKYKKYLKSPLLTIPLRTARRHKLSKASHCGRGVMKKRKLYNFDGSFSRFLKVQRDGKIIIASLEEVEDTRH